MTQIFRQYERIKRNGKHDDGPPSWEPEQDQMPAQQPAGTPQAAPVKDMSPKGVAFNATPQPAPPKGVFPQNTPAFLLENEEN